MKKKEKIDPTPKEKKLCSKCGHQSRYAHSCTSALDVIYRCDQCSYKSKTQEKLEKHKSKGHKTQIQCDFCAYNTPRERYLTVHVGKFHSEVMLGCKECDFKARSLDELRNHCDRLHGQLKCKKCGKEEKNPYALRDHILTVHNMEPGISCNKCDFKAETKYLIAKHVQLEHTETSQYLLEKYEK